MERDKFDEIEQSLRDLRDMSEHDVIVSFGSHRDDQCGQRGSLSVTIHKKGQKATSEALHLYDAFYMCRAKVNRMIADEEKRREEEKATPDA